MSEHLTILDHESMSRQNDGTIPGVVYLVETDTGFFLVLFGDRIPKSPREEIFRTTDKEQARVFFEAALWGARAASEEF